VAPSESHDIAGYKVLLFDDHYVQEKAGFSLRLGCMAADDQPVLRADEP